MRNTSTIRTCTEQEPGPSKKEGGKPELQRLRDENRRLAVSLGGFSAFLAAKGLLEEAWEYVHRIHEQDDGEEAAA